MDLFWLYEEKIIIDTLIHLMKIKRKLLLTLDKDELHLFLKNELVNSCLKEFTIEKCLPMHNYLLKEKEIIID